MEVHAHTHTERKKWTHYFWEFFMMFLAVTLGFFAENQREHYLEHQREKEYAKSLYDDLKVDTMVIQRTIHEKEWVTKLLDSAEHILKNNTIREHNEFLYYAERYIGFNDIFTSQKITFEQLKSSGNFRYFRDLNLYKQLADYYTLYDRYLDVDGSFGAVNKNEMVEVESKLFEPSELMALNNYNPHNFYELVLSPDHKLTPVITDPPMLKQLYVQFENAKYRSGSSITFLNWLNDKAMKILEVMKKDYHFE